MLIRAKHAEEALDVLDKRQLWRYSSPDLKLSTLAQCRTANGFLSGLFSNLFFKEIMTTVTAVVFSFYFFYFLL